MLTWQALAIEIILGLRPRIISMAKACQVNIFQCLPPVDRPLTQCSVVDVYCTAVSLHHWILSLHSKDQNGWLGLPYT